MAATQDDRNKVELQSAAFKEELKNKKLYFEIEITNLKEIRVHNLVITIDKINHFLHNAQAKRTISKSHNIDSSIQADAPTPLTLLTNDEDYDYIWNTEKDYSFRSCIITLMKEMIQQHPSDKRIANCLAVFGDQNKNEKEILKSLLQSQDILDDIIAFIDDLDDVLSRRLVFVIVSHILKQVIEDQGSTKTLHPAASAIIHLTGFTTIIFRSTNYNSFSEDIFVRECDLTSFEKYFENSELSLEREGKIIYTTTK